MNTIKINRDTLLEPLYAVSGIIERRHTLPILSNVLLERKGADITIVATDIEIQISARTVCDNQGGGVYTRGGEIIITSSTVSGNTVPHPRVNRPSRSVSEQS